MLIALLHALASLFHALGLPWAGRRSVDAAQTLTVSGSDRR